MGNLMSEREREQQGNEDMDRKGDRFEEKVAE